MPATTASWPGVVPFIRDGIAAGEPSLVAASEPRIGLLSVSELAANSVRHAGGRGTVRVWTEPDGLLAEVSDRGRFEAPLVGRVRPTPLQLYGRGLWLVNQFCDLVQIRSSDRGSVVRVHVRLD